MPTSSVKKQFCVDSFKATEEIANDLLSGEEKHRDDPGRDGKEIVQYSAENDGRRLRADQQVVLNAINNIEKASKLKGQL